MNNCEKYRGLLVGLLDRELNPQETVEINEHLVRCAGCREEYERLRDTSGKLEAVSFEEPSDEILRRLWRNPFSRLARIGGIFLIVAGYAALICYALFQFFTSGKENFWGKVPIAAIGIGFLILLLLVILERVKSYGKDPYREIKR
ncbi:MAG: zf-HC2 domain-containing protein [Acidobacteria bacterium]|nr:zf-HC2 domain-containing protein [Acidobacteriota bacterium]